MRTRASALIVVCVLAFAPATRAAPRTRIGRWDGLAAVTVQKIVTPLVHGAVKRGRPFFQLVSWSTSQ